MIVSTQMSLLEALSHFFPDSSKRTLLQWIKFGRVAADGVTLNRGDAIVEPGQTLTLGTKQQTESFRGMKILYQDRWIVVIDKPCGLLSVASDHPHSVNALGHLRAYFATPAIYAVHRIDRETSGVLLFARGKESEAKFDTLFETHALTREYVAIVEGQMASPRGTWRSYLLEKENFDVVTTSEALGKPAVTHYTVIRKSNKFSYLRLQLETGRKHQIRVHCKEAGHTILGDKRYGSTCNPARRLCLHASLLRFVHPFTGKEISFSSPLPKEFVTLGAHLET